jgi:hypothetical protein
LILNKEPPPLARFDREAPAELDRIVTKTLTKDLDERYQTAKDLLVDLKRFKRQHDLEAEIERTAPPDFRSLSATGAHKVASSDQLTASAAGATVAASTVSSQVTHQITSAEYIVSEIKRHKKGFAFTGAVVLRWCWLPLAIFCSRVELRH